LTDTEVELWMCIVVVWLSSPLARAVTVAMPMGLGH
jgi:hypothetical protein